MSFSLQFCPSLLTHSLSFSHLWLLQFPTVAHWTVAYRTYVRIRSCCLLPVCWPFYFLSPLLCAESTERVQPHRRERKMTLAEHLKSRKKNFSVLLTIGLVISIENCGAAETLKNGSLPRPFLLFMEWSNASRWMDGWMDGIDFVLQVPGIRYRALVCAPSSIVTEQLRGAGKIVTNGSATQQQQRCIQVGGWARSRATSEQSVRRTAL